MILCGHWLATDKHPEVHQFHLQTSHLSDEESNWLPVICMFVNMTPGYAINVAGKSIRL